MVNDCAFEVISNILGCLGYYYIVWEKLVNFLRPLMCLHRGCGKKRSQKCRKCEGQDKVEMHGNLLLELVADPVSFHLQNYLIAAAIKRFNSAFQFF